MKYGVIILTLLATAASAGLDWEDYRERGQYGPERCSGEITFKDGTKVVYNWISCPIGTVGSDIPNATAPFSRSIEKGSYPRREIQFNAVLRIDFLEFTGEEKQEIEKNRPLYPIKKARVAFRDGTTYEEVFLYSCDQGPDFWEYRSERERGSLNQARSITFRLKDAQTCPQCSRQYLEPEWKFCPHDGTPLEGQK